MSTKLLVNEVLRNEALTRGLADPEARILVEWLVERVEDVAESESCARTARALVSRLSRKCRAISRFVHLWCHERSCGSALQLAGAERFEWPLPPAEVDPCELMEHILLWEARQTPL